MIRCPSCLDEFLTEEEFKRHLEDSPECQPQESDSDIGVAYQLGDVLLG